jgi:hypothetical protein
MSFLLKEASAKEPRIRILIYSSYSVISIGRDDLSRTAQRSVRGPLDVRSTDVSYG